MIREGTFDQILVRPLPSLFQVVASDFAVRRLGKALQGFAVLVYALVGLDVDWTVGRVLAIPLAIVAGALIFGAVWVALATIAFWTVDATSSRTRSRTAAASSRSTRSGSSRAGCGGLVVFVIPIAFVAYFPALYVLDKEDPLGLPERAAVRVAARRRARGRSSAAAVWRNAVRHYRSAGG